MRSRAKNVEVPPYFRCPISFELMEDPVILSSGITYERASIQKWLQEGNKVCPVTRQALESFELIPNRALCRFIRLWCSSRSGPGDQEVNLEEIVQGLKKQDLLEVGLLQRLSRCSVEHSIWKNRGLDCEQLADALKLFVGSKNLQGEEEALAILVTICQLRPEIWDKVAAEWAELPSDLLRLLRSSKKSQRTNAARLLLQGGEALKERAAALEGIVDTLLGLLKNRNDDDGDEAALSFLVSICTAKNKNNSNNKLKAIKSGATNLLIDLLASTSSISNAAKQQSLELLKIMSACAEGREALAAIHSKAMPAILGNLLRISPAATESGTLILWALVRHSAAGDAVTDSFLESGGLSTMVMVLQCNCSLATKQRAGDLLKHFSWLWSISTYDC